jgi:hypothetical protein
LAIVAAADRPKVAERWTALDAGVAGLAADRARAGEAERSYATASGVLAAALDAAGGFPSALALTLESAGRTETRRGEVIVSLAEKRRLRWETARDLAEGGYGHAAAAGFVDAAAVAAALFKTGGELRGLLAAKVAGQNPAALRALAKALADRLSRHPDCPAEAFAALRAAAEGLPAPAYRAWLLALTETGPDFAASLAPADPAEPGAAAFNAALARYVTLVEVRRELSVVWPAAAAAAWYVDSTRPFPEAAAAESVAAGADAVLAPAQDAGLPSPPSEALASLAAFIVAVGRLDPEDVAAAVSADPAFAAAYVEAGGLVWLAAGRDPAGFAAAVGCSSEALRAAVEGLWSVGRLSAASVAVAPETRSFDYAAIALAETTSAAWSAIGDDAELVAKARSLASASPAVAAAIDRGKRYAPLRDRIDAVQRGYLAAAELELSTLVRTSAAFQGGQAALTAAGLGGAPKLDLAVDRSGALAWPRLGVRLIVDLGPSGVVAIAFEPRLFAAVVAAVGSPQFVPAFFIAGGAPSAGELATLHSPAYASAAFASAADAWLAPLAARLGLPRLAGAADLTSRAVFAFATTAQRYAEAGGRR